MMMMMMLDKPVLTKDLQLFMGPGKAVVEVLEVKPTSFAAYAMKIILAFFISGVLTLPVFPSISQESVR
jgi:hypothetical protein